MMYHIDKQGRLNLPNGLLEMSLGTEVQKVVLAIESVGTYRVIPADKIPSDAKIISGPLVLDSKKRLFVPAILRNKHSESVIIYVQNSNFFIQFED